MRGFLSGALTTLFLFGGTADLRAQPSYTEPQFRALNVPSWTEPVLSMATEGDLGVVDENDCRVLTSSRVGVRRVHHLRPLLSRRGVRTPGSGASLQSLTTLYPGGESIRPYLKSDAGTHLLPFPPALADTMLRLAPDDRWLAFDKVQHFTFSFLWTLGGQYTLVNKLGMSESGAAPLSAGLSGSLGLAKEVYDRNAGPTRYFSRKDLVADAAGILLALGLIAL